MLTINVDLNKILIFYIKLINWQKHQRTEQQTGAMFGKQDNTEQDLQIDFWTGGHEVSN
jgi:hypothetical protein